MVKFFIMRLPAGEKINWDLFYSVGKASEANDKLYSSKYYAIRDARHDTTDDYLYICCWWMNPPKGVCVAGVESYIGLYQNGKEI
jgi:hypothetical protein